MCNEHIEGDEWGPSVALARAAPPERGMAYRARAPRSRSHRSSRGWGGPIAGRRVAGRRHMNRGRVRDAHEPEPECLSSTGELIDIERVTISSEGDRWKSTRGGNSLAVYPTSRPVLRRGCDMKSSQSLLCVTSRHDTTRCSISGILRRCAGRQRLVQSLRTMNPQSLDWHRTREGTMYLSTPGWRQGEDGW